MKKVSNLGFIINHKLSCEDHIKSVVGKIYFTLRNLRVSSNAVPVATKLLLVKQLIFPFIHYFENVYAKLDSHSMHILLVALNNAIRFIYGLRRYDHISQYKDVLFGCSLEIYLKIINCIYLHNLIHKQVKKQ